MIEAIILFLLAYMVILQERLTTCDLGHPNSYFFRVDKYRAKRLTAPIKYRTLTFWLASKFGVTTKNTKSMEVYADRYDFRCFILESDSVERYYIFKYLLLLFAASSFYVYLYCLGLPAFMGTILLYFFIMLTFVYDTCDYLTEIGLYALFMIGVIQGWGFLYLMVIAFLANLNRESAVFIVPISVAYCGGIEIIFTTIGALVGFLIPRIIHRKPVNKHDAEYTSGLMFLTFNPITNWRCSIWPHLKARFGGFREQATIRYGRFKTDIVSPIQRSFQASGYTKTYPVYCWVKERFLNRIFLGIAFIAIFFMLLFYSFGDMNSFYRPLAVIFTVFLVMMSFPADIREIRVYAPTFLIIIPWLLAI